MATASDLLFGLQTEYSICLEFTGLGTVYVDRYPVCGGDVKDRLTGGLIHTYGIPAQPFGVSQRSSIGSIKAAHTELAPLTDELSTDFKGEEYKVSVCGVINQGLFDEEVITFDNRVDYVTGTCLGASFGENSFLFSLGDGDSAYSQPILEQTQLDGDLITGPEFSFSSTSSTNQRDAGDVQTDVSCISLSSASQTISISFDQTVDDFEVTLASASSDSKLKTFTYSDVSSTKVSSTGEIVSDIEISATSGSSITVTLTFTPADSMQWIIRDIDSENITNWSIAPDSVSPAYGNAVNSVHTWTNLGGVNQISFDLNNLSGSFDISVPPEDPQTRPHIFGSGVSVKIWPVEIVQAIPLPTSLSWSVSPDTSPDSTLGGYGWEDASLTGVNLTGTFTGVSGSNPLILSGDGNEVTLTNGQVGLKLIFERIYIYPDDDADKIAFIPLVLGNQVNNYTPLNRGYVTLTVGGSPYTLPEYKLGSENIVSVRNDGVAVPSITYAEIATYEGSNTVGYYQRAAPANSVVVTGDPGVITVTGGSDEPYMQGAIEQLAAIASIDPSDVVVGSDVGLWQCGQLFEDNQLTFKEALDQILSPLDYVHFFRNGKLYVERRKTFSMNDFDLELDASAVSDLKVGNPNDRYHKITVYYQRNWTVQPSTVNHKNEYQRVELNLNSVKYSDYPTNTILSGSKEREVRTCFMTTSGANQVAKTLDRDSRVNKPVSFYYDSRKGEIIPNTRVQIPSSILGGSMTDGMLLVTSVQVNTDKKKQFVKGTWYAN